MDAPPNTYERFISHLPTYAAQRDLGASVRLYEALKRDFTTACPGATPDQYTAALQAIAKAAGI